MGNLKIGWSEVSITPDKKVSLYGQFAERISEYVEKPLMATAMAAESCGDQMVIIGCDLVAIEVFLVKAVRERLAGNNEGLDPEKIIINAIHTHTGPGYDRAKENEAGKGAFKVFLDMMKPYFKPGQKYVESAQITDNPEIASDQEVFDMLVDRLSTAALEAWKNRKPASFKNGFGRAAVGMCRRVDYSDGTAQMWGDANTAVFTELEGGNDSGVELMYTFDEAGKLTGAMVNVCCPAQCVQHRLFVSPDFWGETKKLLREKFGPDFYVLPTCSTAGDQCPVDLVRWVNPDTDVHDPNLIRHNPPVRKADPSMFDLEGMRKAGKRVANAVIDAYEEGLGDAQSEIKFEHHVHNMQLPLRRATLSEKNAALKEVASYIRALDRDLDFNDIANLQVYLGIIQRFNVQESVNIQDTEVHIIRMGSVAIATYPYEVFLDYGNQIKARQLCEQSFLIQLANGSIGYLPTEKAEAHGHYSAFIGSGTVGHIGGDQLVRETLKDINGMFAGDYKVYEYKE